MILAADYNTTDIGEDTCDVSVDGGRHQKTRSQTNIKETVAKEAAQTPLLLHTHSQTFVNRQVTSL